MDTLEETPIADISATYLTDEQFNNLYPKHPIDVSNYLLMFTFRSCNCVTLVFPVFHVFPVLVFPVLVFPIYVFPVLVFPVLVFPIYVFPVFNVFPVFTYNIHSLFHFLNLGTNGY